MLFKSLFQSIEKDKYLFIIPFVTIIIRAIVYYCIPHTYEDAYITFKYSENLASGFGLVYNIGEKVYGTTTPLFAIIIAFFKYAGIPSITSSLILNLISESLTSIIVYKYLSHFSKGITLFIISLLFVFSPSNISWSVQGMETAFFGAIIAVSFYNLYKKNYFIAVLFAFLSAVTRIDGLSVVFVISLFTVFEKKLLAIKTLIIPLLIFLVWLIFLQSYFGNFLPNSMLAKLILYSGHSQSIIPNLNIVLSKFFISGFYSSTILTILFLIGIYVVVKSCRRLLPMAIWFFIYYFALVMSKTLIHGWYLVPPLFVFITISGIGIIFIFNKIVDQYIKYRKLLNLALFTFVIMFSALTLVIKLNQMNREFQYEHSVRKPIGEYLNNFTPLNSTVFLEPIGIIGYFSKRYIYDDAALISPIFLEINRLPYNARSVYKKIDLVKPDYLVLRDRDLEEFYNTTDLRFDYEIIKNFTDPINLPDSSSLSMTIFKSRNKINLFN